ncbi:MAG: DNA methyltransferase [Deltaproteobacteria bacterium]|nr:DNA methyltransferase [Deltaproteobacteria bacterium]
MQDEDSYDDAPSAPERRAFSTWEGPVTTGGDRALAAPLRSLFALDPEQNRSLTHGFHPYAARMPPSLANQAIALWSKPGETVVDPFMGSGTVLVEAFAQGRKAVGNDASPLAVMIATTRTTLLSREEAAALVIAGQAIATEAEDRARRRQKLPSIAPWARLQHANFHPHVFLELYGLRGLVFDWKGPENLSRALRLCFSSILGKFMAQGDAAPRDGHKKRIGRGVPSNFFGRRVNELVSQLESLRADVPEGTPAPRIHQGDARELKPIKSASANLVLTSPPYAGVYDYGAIHASRFAWLGLDPRPLYAKQVGVRARGLGAEPGAWEQARKAWLSQIARVLVPGGHAIVVVGDGVVGENAENVQSAIWAVAPEVGLTPLAFASQPRPSHDKRIRDIFGDVPRREHVLVLRKDEPKV